MFIRLARSVGVQNTSGCTLRSIGQRRWSLRTLNERCCMREQQSDLLRPSMVATTPHCSLYWTNWNSHRPHEMLDRPILGAENSLGPIRMRASDGDQRRQHKTGRTTRAPERLARPIKGQPTEMVQASQSHLIADQYRGIPVGHVLTDLARS